MDVSTTNSPGNIPELSISCHFKILFLLEFARDSQLVPSFTTTAGKDLAAVGGLHALAKTMY